MQIWKISAEMKSDVKFSNFPPFLLSIKQQFSNCVWRRSFSLMLFIEPGQLAGCPSINKLTGTLEKSWLFHGKQLCRLTHLPRGKLSSLLFSSKFNTTIGTFYIEVNIKWMESFFLVRAQSERFKELHKYSTGETYLCQYSTKLMEIISRIMKTFILFWSDLIHIFIEPLHFLLIVIICGSITVTVAPTFTAKYS